MRNVSDKSRENENTHTFCMFSNVFQKIVPCMRLYGKICGTARQVTDVNITRRMRFACWISKATDTHSEYAIFIAFSRQETVRLSVDFVQLDFYVL
jgi:hypothetical protein